MERSCFDKEFNTFVKMLKTGKGKTIEIVLEDYFGVQVIDKELRHLIDGQMTYIVNLCPEYAKVEFSETIERKHKITIYGK